MSFELIVVSEMDNGRRTTLADGKSLTIGRGTNADFQLSDPHMSRQHCRVELNGDETTVTDLQSTGGTLVNGKTVEKTVLNDGDRIQIGESTILFRGDIAAQSTMVTKPDPIIAPPKDTVKDLEALVGKTIHDFEISEKLAEGKSGIVFKADDTKKKRVAALKILWPELSKDEQAAQRFVRGMKTMFPIRHPNIIQLYSAGMYKNLCWVAMEFVDGEDLTKVIDRIGLAGMIDWQFGFQVALQIGRALSLAFDHQIVHRNITPKNILYNENAKTFTLGDLMLAKALEKNPAEQITRPGQLIGEIAYAAPERTGGDADIDCRSDIYGLGATVYALLTGHSPFEAQSLPELIRKIRNDKPESPTKFQLSINSMFEGAVLRMLEKRPGDRYQSPQALLQDLERIGKFCGIPSE